MSAQGATAAGALRPRRPMHPHHHRAVRCSAWHADQTLPDTRAGRQQCRQHEPPATSQQCVLHSLSLRSAESAWPQGPPPAHARAIQPVAGVLTAGQTCKAARLQEGARVDYPGCDRRDDHLAWGRHVSDDLDPSMTWWSGGEPHGAQRRPLQQPLSPSRGCRAPPDASETQLAGVIRGAGAQLSGKPVWAQMRS